MGKVYLPKGAPWVEALMHELLLFDNGKNDDQVDVLSLFGRMLADMVGKKPPRAEKLSLNDQIAEATKEAWRGDTLIKSAERNARRRNEGRKPRV